jgi:hypothetical protein
MQLKSKRRHSPKCLPTQFAGASRNKGYCVMFGGQSPTFPQPIRRRGGCRQCSMLGELSRTREGSYFWMSLNLCSSSQMAANIAGLSLDRP